tara:strand:+ start:270 stop:776 length:507 start_codon:yes stop_codon:yes gene_type:complete
MLNDYLITNYDKLKDMAYNITSGKGNEDLLSFVIEELYKCNQEKINDIIVNNDMNWYIARVMVNQFHSKTSRYYYKYNKYYEYHVTGIIEAISPDTTEKTIEEKEIVEQRLHWIEKKLKNLYWFDAECFRIYYRESHSLNSLSKATKISRATIYKSIRNVTNYLKNEK